MKSSISKKRKKKTILTVISSKIKFLRGGPNVQNKLTWDFYFINSDPFYAVCGSGSIGIKWRKKQSLPNIFFYIIFFKSEPKKSGQSLRY